MNHLTVDVRSYFNKLRNDDDFTDNPTDYAGYFKALVWEDVKFVSGITIKTNLLASPTAEILFTTDGTTATWTHPYLNWGPEGFKVGNTIRVVRGVNTEDATIASISGNVMTCNDPGFVAGLTIVSGTSYDDLEFRNTTIPTSLVFKFGIVPNSVGGLSLSGSNPYASWLDNTITQAYKTGGVTTAPVALAGVMPVNTEITDSITIEHTTTTDDWIFTYDLVHIFTVIGYNGDYFTHLQNHTTPTNFSTPYSYRYVCEYLFGTDPNDPNEYRTFKDNLLNGAVGWIDNNFTAGAGDYNLNTLAYTVGGVTKTQAEVTATTTVTGKIKKTSGNWVAGDRVILYHFKAADPTEYLGNLNTFEENFLFDSKLTTEGAANVSSDIITNFSVDIDGGDATLLGFSFQLIYDTTQQGFVDNGDYYFLGMQVGDNSLSAALSDRKIVWMDVNTFYKNTDIPGLITNNDMQLYTSEKTPNGTLYTSDVNSWNNRLHHAIVHFDLTKNTALPTASNFIKVMGMKGQVIARNKVTFESFVLDNYDMPISAFMAGVGGGWYQIVNSTNYRNFNIKPLSQARKSTITSDFPGAYSATQEWIVRWPFVLNWREWQYNPNVPTSFYDALQANNNFNYRTSNYNLTGSDWEIRIRLLVTVNNQGVNTDYGILSTKCVVRDFDVDPAALTNWSATTELLDENGAVVDEIRVGQDMRIKTTFSMATAGALDPLNLVAEHTIEESNSTSDNWRLNSSVDWGYDGNLLIPLTGETKVKITQDVPGNKIIVESLIDKDYVDPSKSYNVYTHLQDTR